MSEAYDGEERRKCTGCANIEKLDRRVSECKQEFDTELRTVKDTITGLGAQVNALRADVHTMTASIGSINTSLESIAATLTTSAATLSQLADLPEAWTALKGFWRVLRFLRENAILLAIIGSAIWYSTRSLA